MLKTARTSFEPTIIHASGLRLDLELKNMNEINIVMKIHDTKLHLVNATMKLTYWKRKCKMKFKIKNENCIENTKHMQ